MSLVAPMLRGFQSHHKQVVSTASNQLAQRT